ncbi:TonB-dependent receptor, partial [candidate division FCPU426 bacterium]|nr:TonB-dependent receptor [candidate division FCPU426 bacterium]
GAPLRRMPPLMGTVGVAVSTGQYWVEYYSTLARKQDRLSGGDLTDARIPAGGTPGYVTFNLKGGVYFSPDSTLAITLENLSDEDYKTHGSGIYAPGTNVVVTYQHSLDIL